MQVSEALTVTGYESFVGAEVRCLVGLYTESTRFQSTWVFLKNDKDVSF